MLIRLRRIGEVVDGAAVILGVDDRRRLGREAGEILRDGDRPPRSWSPRKVFRVIGRRDLAGLDEARRDLVDPPVQVLEEMLGLEEVGDPVIGVVVDEDRARAAPARHRCCSAASDTAARRPPGGRSGRWRWPSGAPETRRRRQTSLRPQLVPEGAGRHGSDCSRPVLAVLDSHTAHLDAAVPGLTLAARPRAPTRKALPVEATESANLEQSKNRTQALRA